MARQYPIGICIECGEEKGIEAKGMCRRCYNRLWARRKGGGGSREEYFDRLAKEKAERSFGICKTCGEEKKLQSLGMCRNCYKKTVGTIVKCARCGEERKHEARGLCAPCYVNTVTAKRKTKTVICAICGEEKVHKAKGLCTRCYRNQYKKTWQKKIIICACCGEEVEHEANGMCYRCWWKSVGGRKYNHQRLSRKSELPATLTQDEWLLILDLYGHSCAYCGIRGVELVQEHWIPMVRGGGYTADNIVPACVSCNSRKHTMTGDEFLEYLKNEALWQETSKSR